MVLMWEGFLNTCVFFNRMLVDSLVIIASFLNAVWRRLHGSSYCQQGRCSETVSKPRGQECPVRKGIYSYHTTTKVETSF